MVLKGGRLGIAKRYPCGASYRAKNEKTNAILKDWLAKNRGRFGRVTWVDINDRFLVQDGKLPQELFGDSLHPTAKVYDIWADALLERVLK